MARKKEITQEKKIDLSLDDIVSDRFGRYSKYIIQERALPDARDGLKPVQRRILYSMNLEGNTYDKPHRKSAKSVGSVMGTFHPHGDTSIYDAMVRMSQDWKINLPLIDMHGNNGSIDDDPPAAYRYTEARLSKNASYLLEDIEKNSVAMTNNYDDTMMEPTVLPAKFPLLLVNGSTGIASGYATNIAPHNLNEVVDATIYRINHPNCSLDKLMEFIKGPDFPTGGIVQGKDNIREIFETGKGKVVLRSKCEIKEGKTGSEIIVTEIPYEVVKVQLVKRINDLFLSKEIDGISDVRDDSGRDGLKITIEIKKDVDPHLILNYLYKNTDLQINYSYNNIAIVDHRPQLLSLPMALDDFIEHRRDVVTNRSIFLRDKKKARIHIVEGLIKAVSVLDELVDIIRKSKDKKDAKERICKAFGFTDEQAEAIVNLRLYRLTNTDVQELKDEYALLVKEIAELESILNSKEVLDSVLVNELKEINKTIITPRKTIIEDEVEEIVIDKVKMIANEVTYVVVSKDGYIKRFSERAYAANENQLPMTKDTDSLIGIKKCDTLDVLLLFTAKGNYIYLPIYKIDECKFKDLGKHVSTYAKMESQEKIVGACIVKNFETYAFITLLTKKGMIKKSGVEKYNTSRYSKAMTAIKLKNDDEVVSMALTYSDEDLLLITKDGLYNRYDNMILADLAAKAQGVAGINVKNDEAVALLSIKKDDDILLVTKRGSMKRIHNELLELTNRNTKGNRLFKQTKTNPNEIKKASVVNTYTNLMIDDSKELKTLDVKEVPYMDLSSTFSSVIDLSDNFDYIKKDMSDIVAVEIIDYPEDYNKEDVQLEQMNLF